MREALRRENDARETTTEPIGRNRPGLPARPGSGVGHWQRWRLGVSRCGRVAGRTPFPENHLRSRPRPLLQIRAPRGPGHAARAHGRRLRNARGVAAAAWAVRTRPRSGAGQGGGGKRTPCVCECEFLTPATSSISVKGKLLATLENLYLQPACEQVGSLVVALPRHCIRPPGHFVVTGLSRRRARCIT